MSFKASHRAALFLAAALAPIAQAQAAPCSSAGAVPIQVGAVAGVAPGAARSFTLSLSGGEGVIVDLVTIKADGAGEGHDEHEGGSATPARALALCDAGGKLLAPLPSEVFAKGGSHAAIEEGERLRFIAPAAAQYVVTVAASAAPREVLVRRREISASGSAPRVAVLGSLQKGTVSSAAQVVYSFVATAGQWVEIKSTSEKDTLLRLAGPDRDGTYAQIAENDDSDGLNPVIRRKLPVAGTYYVQVDGLSAEEGEFELSLRRVEAPKPPPPPAVLRLGAATAGRLADGDAVVLYNLPVVAGRSYKLELTAPYDGVVAIGLPNPLEPEDGSDKPDAGFAEVKSQDGGVTGTEKLVFTARSSGSLLVRVKSFGIGETDGAYTLTATDMGQ